MSFSVIFCQCPLTICQFSLIGTYFDYTAPVLQAGASGFRAEAFGLRLSGGFLRGRGLRAFGFGASAALSGGCGACDDVIGDA